MDASKPYSQDKSRSATIYVPQETEVAAEALPLYRETEGTADAPNDILRKASEHAGVVYALTKSNHETFECLKVFCEKYNEKRTFIHSHSKHKVYKHVVEQAGVYVGTIDASIRMAERGMSISRGAKEALDDKTLIPEVFVEPMLEQTGEALKDIKDISNRFRGIRVALFEEMQRVHPSEPPSDPSFPPSTDLVRRQRVDLNGKYFHLSYPVTLTKRASELRRMDEKDLLKLTVLVLDQFVSIVGEFVDWWNSLKVDVDRLTGSIRYIRKNPNISTQVFKQWENMEQQYKIYRSEIMAQQDYYNHTLKDLMPKSFFRRVKVVRATKVNGAKTVVVVARLSSRHVIPVFHTRIHKRRSGSAKYTAKILTSTLVDPLVDMEVALGAKQGLNNTSTCTDLIVSANDLTGLSDAARKTFQIFEPWSRAEFTFVIFTEYFLSPGSESSSIDSVENDLLKDIIGFIKAQSQAYCRALSSSVGTSRNCVMLADGAVDLCRSISEGTDATEVSATIDLLIETTKLGVEQAEDVVQKFRTLRQGIFQLTGRIPYAVEQVVFEHQVCEVSKHRYQRAAKGTGYVHRALAGFTETVAPIIAPIMSAAIPGLGIILPVVLPLATLATRKADERLRFMIQSREKQQIACEDAIKRLQDVSNDMGKVAEHVGKFAVWWQDMEYTFRNLQTQIHSTASGMAACDPVLLSMLESRFSEISRNNRNYIADITRLEDFYPKLGEHDGFHQRISNSNRYCCSAVQPKDDFPFLLQAITKSTHQYHIAYHRLDIMARDAKPKHRLSLDRNLDVIRECLKAECEALHDVLRCISESQQSHDSRNSIDETSRIIRQKLFALAGKSENTKATFEERRRDVASKLPSPRQIRRSQHEYTHLSKIMNNLVAPAETNPPLISLEGAIKEQHASIQDFVRFFNTYFSSVTISAIASTGGTQAIELWDFDRGHVTEVMDKVLVSADSLGGRELVIYAHA
ncbi:hypothetical protein PLEOSDRAFT_171596 [Pleurotus ostreatus PC15]|uniref:Uncharacterized protein n=1 Tax=Pleurotus ostreatus (strain PC15) TaxID=1137138 RepID=A0A067N564_PLEO1|nr:hypothetical protein PLEOSDRAFT_171596 [Pleurotus ostreatus PC15]